MLVTMSKSLNLPEGTPKDVVEAWRNAARMMLKDADFITKKAKIFGAYPQTISDQALEVRDAATRISPEAKAWLKPYLKENHGVDLK